jgi:hypothetical protein
LNRSFFWTLRDQALTTWLRPQSLLQARFVKISAQFDF